MLSRTLLGRGTARLVALVGWLTGGRLIKSQAPSATTYSGPYDGSRMPWWQSESYYHDLGAFGSEESGSTSTAMTQPKSYELSPEDTQYQKSVLFHKYGIKEIEE